MSEKEPKVEAVGLKEWVEPEIRALALSETALNPGRGPDGNTVFIDCTSDS